MLGKRLAELRNKKGLSQYELAERLGFSRGKLANYEQGSRQPDYDTLLKLSEYFGVSTDYLLGRTDEMNGRVSIELMKAFAEILNRRYELDIIKTNRNLTNNEIDEYKLISNYLHGNPFKLEIEHINAWMNLSEQNKVFEVKNELNKVTVAGQQITLSIEELQLFNELKKHPIMFNDLASDPEAKVKELIKLYKVKKLFLEEDTEEYGDGFGELED